MSLRLHSFHRLADFQRLTIKLIATKMLQTCNPREDDYVKHGQLLLRFGNEVEHARFYQTRKIELYYSEFNAGAKQFLKEELRARLRSVDGVNVQIKPFEGKAVFECSQEEARQSAATSQQQRGGKEVEDPEREKGLGGGGRGGSGGGDGGNGAAAVSTATRAPPRPLCLTTANLSGLTTAKLTANLSLRVRPY